MKKWKKRKKKWRSAPWLQMHKVYSSHETNKPAKEINEQKTRSRLTTSGHADQQQQQKN